MLRSEMVAYICVGDVMATTLNNLSSKEYYVLGENSV
jgi:hypothetical protein